MEHIKQHYPAILTTMFGLAIWESYVRLMNVQLYILPAPSLIIKALISEGKIIFFHTATTLYEAILGFVLAIIFGFILAIMIDSFSFLKRGIYPLLVASQTIPIMALAPLFFIWFGFGLLPKVLVVVIVAFFPIVVNLVDGLNSTDRGLTDLLLTMNASKWQIFKKVKLPSALPSLFSGLRIAATYSVMGAVIGEWLGASKGLGMYIKNTMHSYLTDRVFAAIIVIVVASVLFYSSLLFIESRLVAWNKK